MVQKTTTHFGETSKLKVAVYRVQQRGVLVEVQPQEFHSIDMHTMSRENNYLKGQTILHTTIKIIRDRIMKLWRGVLRITC
jgi:hypothetical protein